MVDIPETEPLELVVGDRWQWRRTDLSTDYPATSWTLTYYFVQLVSATPGAFNIVADADGDDFSIDVAPVTTAANTAGEYRWAAYVSKVGDRVEIGKASIVLKPDLAVVVTDPRTDAETILDAINAVIAGRATVDQESYSINNRSLSRTPIDDLLTLRDDYQQRVASERRQELRSQGRQTRNQVRVRFTG